MVPHLFAQTMAILSRLDGFTFESFGYLISGGTSAAIALIILYPIEQMNVRATVVSSQARTITLKTIFDDFIHLKMDNIADIYKGLIFSLIEKFIFIGTYFFFYSLLIGHHANVSMSTALFRGAFAGILTQIFTSPLGTIQKILQTTNKRNVNPIAIVNNVPLFALWSGLAMNIILVINPAINMYLYEYFTTDNIAMVYIFGENWTVIHFVSGLLSKLIATIICYPFIFIKNNQQSSQQQAEPKTIRDILMNTYGEHGVNGFYKGFRTKLVQTTLNNALMFVVKEKVDVFVQSRFEYLHHIGLLYFYASILFLGYAIFRCLRYSMNGGEENQKLLNETKVFEEEIGENQVGAPGYV